MIDVSVTDYFVNIFFKFNINSYLFSNMYFISRYLKENIVSERVLVYIVRQIFILICFLQVNNFFFEYIGCV